MFINTQMAKLKCTWNLGMNFLKLILDNLIQKLWEDAKLLNVFRYTIEYLETKVITGNYNFVIQKNCNRAFERRAPQSFPNMHQNFNDNKFNFTKIKPQEVLFKFLHTKGDDLDEENYIIINASPLEYGNILFVPKLYDKLPQILTYDAIQLCLKFMVSSHNITLRMAYNSQLASASVNHLHIHAYYLRWNLSTENMKLVPLVDTDTDTNGNNASQISYFVDFDYPILGFAFVLKRLEDVQDVSGKIYSLTCYLESEDIPHNMFITRGRDPESPNHAVAAYDCVRIYIWPRKPNFASKCSVDINVAACEISGHVLVKDDAHFRSIDYSEMADILRQYSFDRSFIDKVAQNVFFL
ncbi:GDP-D-glucose phosphorylase 1-like isoform X1 [Gordionus sp. m RMFG-2023]|uniref:GDP-D-glucose phosphorylase 1-like isoform X1 n=1 Tax=Gordionus sp. m RMFG-2023 TaxID=3053472 RepID=UPI0031FBE4E2